MTREELIDKMVSCYDNGEAMLEYVEEYYAQRTCENCKYDNRCEIQDTITYINRYEETANDKPLSCSHWESKDD